MMYTAPCNFLTKRALLSQQAALVVVAKGSNSSHYLNVSIHLPTAMIPII